MAKVTQWLLYGAITLAAVLVLLTWLGGGINWNQQPHYERVQSWGGSGAGPGRFSDPTGIAVTADEVFVADARNSRIQVFNKQGEFKRAFGTGVLGRPMNLDIANGKLYAPDYFKDVVHVFTLQGDNLQAIEAEDGFDSPGGVAVYPDGSLLVADTYKQRIVHIDTDGRVLKRWGGKGSRAGEFNYPTDVALAPGGGFYVADGYNDRIQQLGADGEFIRKWGGPFAINIFGPFKGWFATVSSLAVSPHGNVFAVDFYNERIQKFNRDGGFLTTFGTASNGPRKTQIAVAVDAEGAVWSTNFAENRVEQWTSLGQ